MLYTQSMNERNTSLEKYLSHFILEKGPRSVVSWEIDGETYTQRGYFFLSHIFFREPGVPTFASPPPGSRVIREVRNATDRLRVPGPTPDSLALSKSDLVIITWSPSGYTPVGPDCLDVLSSLCLLITTWQLVKAHGVTRNKLKIHVICYIYIYIYIIW